MEEVSKCAEINCSSFDNRYFPLEHVNIEIWVLKATVQKLLLSSIVFLPLYLPFKIVTISPYKMSYMQELVIMVMSNNHDLVSLKCSPLYRDEVGLDFKVESKKELQCFFPNTCNMFPWDTSMYI